MTQYKNPIFALWIVILLGGGVRLMPVFLAGFPVNDGGMFLSMIRDLGSNNFILPLATSYNFSDIPFVYPPFGIYVAVILVNLFSISGLDVLRWLPPLVSVFVIVAFFGLASQVFASRAKAIVATAIYAFLPGSFDWLVMGGGLTRSFGVLFHLVAVSYVFLIFRNADRKKIGLAALACALSVLSHPEAGLQTATICLMLWLFYGRSFEGVRNALLIAMGTIFLTAPWWATVLYKHGLSPFFSAMHTGIHETLLASLFHSIFSVQGVIPIVPIFFIIGTVVALRKRDFFLMVWVFLPFFVDPRNAPAIAIFPIVMILTEGMCYLGAGLTQASLRSSQFDKVPTMLPLLQFLFVVLISYLFFVSYKSAANLVYSSLTLSERGTMRWVKENTDVDSQFLLITNAGHISPMADAYQEWFPVLAERRSRNTLQGLEWTLGSDFFPYSQKLVALQACQDFNCLDSWLKQENARVDFLLLEKRRASPDLADSLRANLGSNIIYESSNAIIFAYP